MEEQYLPDAWALLSDAERAELAKLARWRMHIPTLEERGGDSLDFHDVSVWAVRDALARVYLAGSGRQVYLVAPTPPKS